MCKIENPFQNHLKNIGFMCKIENKLQNRVPEKSLKKATLHINHPKFTGSQREADFFFYV